LAILRYNIMAQYLLDSVCAANHHSILVFTGVFGDYAASYSSFW
jgi:hypothetical protein